MIGPDILLALAFQGTAPGPVPPAAAPYWQQRVAYDITATLDESQGALSGAERIVYHNNSPDTLRTFALHLYLNAFRPGSRWADADSAEHRRRFNDLRDPDYGFNRVEHVRIMDRPVEAVYPFAPDSTIVRYALPRPLAPGDSMLVTLDWAARPSTVPRRQGRRGRQYDFAQWYPRVVAYDRFGWEEHPLYPAGEFYGDFGDFTVRLDVPEDQVVGATGVPVCGDPGWAAANRNPARPVEYGRERFGGMICSGITPAGRKSITWMARDVHHFAMSMSPEYRYEGGKYGDVLVHVLYQPGDVKSWGGGVAVRNTEAALEWLDGLFGPFPWPQLTNVHRIEGGGTEFPMMVHNGSAGIGLIVHEVGHNYVMGILANNEWKEAFLDEGFTSFQTSWFTEAHGGRSGYGPLERGMLLSDLEGRSEPTSLVSDRYRDFGTYNSMVYNRGELFYHQLRAMVGDSVMRAILRTYYQRWKLKHVDEAAFRAVAEEVSHRDLGAFFAQWLHTTELYDYAVGRVGSTRVAGDGGSERWHTRVEILRKAPGVFPVDVVVRSRTDSATVRADGIGEREWVELTTRERPRGVEVDPRGVSHDWNALNNRKTRGLFGFGRSPRHSVYLDRLFSRPTRRDGLTVGLVPVAWYNEEGGFTIGLRSRSDYLGRFDQHTLSYTIETRKVDEGWRDSRGIFFQFRNPTFLYQPRTRESFEVYDIEGRVGLAASVEHERLGHRGFGAQTFTGASLRWLTTHDTDYLDPARWDAGGTVEAALWVRSQERRGAWMVTGRLSAGGGIEYRNRGGGLVTRDRYDVQPYFRAFGEVTGRRAIGRLFGVGLRGFAGWIASDDPPLKQRQFFLAGADPYQQFGNPFLRSRGALLVRNHVNYQMPGGAGVRGLDPAARSTAVVAVNLEVDRAVLSRNRKLFNEIRIALFGDGALGNGDLPPDGSGAAVAADAGVGLRLRHRIGETTFHTRFDFPLLVTRPRLAIEERSRGIGARWIFSFEPAF